jgi:hypothetical protein
VRERCEERYGRQNSVLSATMTYVTKTEYKKWDSLVTLLVDGISTGEPHGLTHIERTASTIDMEGNASWVEFGT